MWILLSHIIGFVALSAGALYDLKTTEVPDSVSIFAIVSGLALHGIQSYFTGSLEPILWSLGVGAVFSVYGWGSYYLGIWGGADAFAMSALGFVAPFSLDGISINYSINLFINMMLIGFMYTLGFSVYQAFKSGNVVSDTYEKILEQEKRIAAEILVAAVLSAALQLYVGMIGLFYFAGLTFMIFLYRFLKVLEREEMTKEVPVSDLEGGEVVAAGQGAGRTIKGITEEEIEDLENDRVEVKTGVRFVPVFPLAILVTDLVGGGLVMIATLFSL